MSDLTITHAGVATTRNTSAEVLTAGKKLTQMSMDVFAVRPTVTTNACSDGEIIFNATKISNLVNTKGGSCMIQSVQIVDDDLNGAAMDLIFFNALLTLGTPGGAIDASDGAVPDNILGIVTVTNYFNGVNWEIGHKENIGLIIKAADEVRDIYVAAVNRSGASKTYTASGLRLRIGVLQD